MPGSYPSLLARGVKGRARLGQSRHSRSGAYIAKAVHFDGLAWLVNDSLIATDNAYFSLSGWLKTSSASPIATLYVADPDDTFTSNAVLTPETGGYTFTLNNASSLKIYADDALSGTVLPDQWHHFLYSGDTNHAAGAKKVQLYIDDELKSSAIILDEDPAFSLLWNGLPFWFGNDGSSTGILMDCADFRIMPGISLLDGAGDIPLATRRLFIDDNGKPVDPAVATAALGAPCVLFSGDATGFKINQGTGGPFVLTGALTDAADSPSGSPVPSLPDADRFDQFDLFAGSGPWHTTQMQLTDGTAIQQFQVLTILDNRLLPWTAGAAKPFAIAAQAVDAATPGSFVPVFVSGGFNHEALVWDASIDTLAERQELFAGSPIYVQQLL